MDKKVNNTYQYSMRMGKKNIRIEEVEEVNLRSEEVQEIMGRMPSWIERWGITVIGLLLIIILAGAAFFPYPDKLTGQFLYEPKSFSPERRIIGYVFLPAHGIGKVKKGQEARIRLENYPDLEFGHLTGLVQNVAKVPDKKGFYQVEILFNNGLKTSEDIQLSTHSQMSGTAEIILAEKHLIDQFGIIGKVTKREK